MDFSTPLSSIPRIGPVHQRRLKRLGITTVRDLLFHFPREYEDFSVITKISEVKEGRQQCVRGKILEITDVRTFKRRLSITKAAIADETGAIRVVWFNQPYLVTVLQKDQEIYVAGRIARDKEGIFITNPVYEKVDEQNGSGDSSSQRFLTHVGRIVPVYEETSGISSRWIRAMIKGLLVQIRDVPEILPPSILQIKNFPPLVKALWQIHFPDSLEAAKEAKKRFSFEELFYILLFILSERKKIASVKAPPIPFSPEMMKRFTDSLSFELTDAQKKCAWHILKDIEKPRPMNRLLQGDVGSGKTVVAAMAALSVLKAGYQVAFMAPTEILAQQHFKTVSQLLARFKITVGLLTGTTDRFVSPKLPNDFIEISRKRLLEKALEGDINIVIGTHALIQDKVKFGKLALVVLDEQHRFGVAQRAKLLHRSTLIPHLLSMTATPIPRTLAMTVYGDLDLSLIDEMPKGRKPIITKIVAPQEREKAYEFLRKQIQDKHQIFIICPRIEKTSDEGKLQFETNGKTKELNDTEGVKTVKEEYEKLSKEVFPEAQVGMLHGKMGAREKEEVMKKLKRGKIDILVSTSVVEVGVDIPNATVMMIEGAERFGLAQLHQFRGRVGRSEYQSYCFLFTDSNAPRTKHRLQALLEAKNGFELAERDLEIRGPGDFAGTKQWGIPDFAMSYLTDLSLVEEARESARKILEEDISLSRYPQLKKRMGELREKLHLE